MLRGGTLRSEVWWGMSAQAYATAREFTAGDAALRFEGALEQTIGAMTRLGIGPFVS